MQWYTVWYPLDQFDLEASRAEGCSADPVRVEVLCLAPGRELSSELEYSQGHHGPYPERCIAEVDAALLPLEIGQLLWRSAISVRRSGEINPFEWVLNAPGEGLPCSLRPIAPKPRQIGDCLMCHATGICAWCGGADDPQAREKHGDFYRWTCLCLRLKRCPICQGSRGEPGGPHLLARYLWLRRVQAQASDYFATYRQEMGKISALLEECDDSFQENDISDCPVYSAKDQGSKSVPINQPNPIRSFLKHMVNLFC